MWIVSPPSDWESLDFLPIKFGTLEAGKTTPLVRDFLQGGSLRLLHQTEKLGIIKVEHSDQVRGPRPPELGAIISIVSENFYRK